MNFWWLHFTMIKMKQYIEDIVIHEEMRQLDSELIHFLAETNEEEDGE